MARSVSLSFELLQTVERSVIAATPLSGSGKRIADSTKRWILDINWRTFLRDR
jgi:hypothetical protein